VSAYKIAALRGFVIIIGHKIKQITKQASAPILHPLKMRIRSHLLTIRGTSQPFGALLE
jgi:hypothetical protein